MSWTASLTLNHKLGLLALGLGAVATVATVKHDRTVTVHAKELLTRVERAEDHVTPAELATWIIEGRSDYRLIDIRDAAAYAKYHIPTAEHLPLAQLTDGALAHTDKIILHGDGGIHAAQGWMVLSGMGYHHVYSLLEGLDAWKEDVLFPVAPTQGTAAERAQFERTAQVAKFFGGQARAAVAPGATGEPGVPAMDATPKLPAAPVLAPSLPVGAGPGAAPKKKREGC